MNEKYYDTTKTTSQACRQYVDLFGIMQKVPNALDILIEDAKNHLKTWGSAPPSWSALAQSGRFLLCLVSSIFLLWMVHQSTRDMGCCRRWDHARIP